MRVVLLLLAGAVAWGRPPAILFTDVESGPVSGGPNGAGVPISIFGTGFGAAKGDSKVTIGGVEVAAYPVWGEHNATNKTLDMIVVQPGANTKGGPIVVTVAGEASNANFTFAVNKGKIKVLKPGDNVADAFKKAGPGDTVLLHGGTYRDGEIWIREVEGDSGKPGEQKTLKNWPGEEPVFDNRERPFYVSANYLTVSGLRHLNGKSLGITEEGDKTRLKGDKLVNNYGKGNFDYSFLDSHGDNHTLAGNVCEAAGSSQGTQGHCYYISYGDGVKILWNTAAGVPGYGIHVFDQRRANPDFKRVISNMLIEGNIVKHSTDRSGMILSMADENGMGNVIDGVVIRNNVFTGNNHSGLVLNENVRNAKIYHNTFYQNGRVELFIEDKKPLVGVEVKNNLFYHSKNSWCKSNCGWYPDGHIQFTVNSGKAAGLASNAYFPGNAAVFNGDGDGAGSISVAGPISGALQFTNAAELDFRPKAGSVVLNRGAAVAVTTDYNGVARPQEAGTDIGAFEFVP